MANTIFSENNATLIVTFTLRDPGHSQGLMGTFQKNQSHPTEYFCPLPDLKLPKGCLANLVITRRGFQTGSPHYRAKALSLYSIDRQKYQNILKGFICIAKSTKNPGVNGGNLTESCQKLVSPPQNFPELCQHPWNFPKFCGGLSMWLPKLKLEVLASPQ